MNKWHQGPEYIFPGSSFSYILLSNCFCIMRFRRCIHEVLTPLRLQGMYLKSLFLLLKTFTAYGKRAPIGTCGRVFFINDSGVLEPTLENSRNTSCNDTLACSDPNLVDGKSYRSFIGVNKRIPGPTLIVPEGATVLLTSPIICLQKKPQFMGMVCIRGTLHGWMGWATLPNVQ